MMDPCGRREEKETLNRSHYLASFILLGVVALREYPRKDHSKIPPVSRSELSSSRRKWKDDDEIDETFRRNVNNLALFTDCIISHMNTHSSRRGRCRLFFCACRAQRSPAAHAVTGSFRGTVPLFHRLVSDRLPGLENLSMDTSLRCRHIDAKVSPLHRVTSSARFQLWS